MKGLTKRDLKNYKLGTKVVWYTKSLGILRLDELSTPVCEVEFELHGPNLRVIACHIPENVDRDAKMPFITDAICRYTLQHRFRLTALCPFLQYELRHDPWRYSSVLGEQIE